MTRPSRPRPDALVFSGASGDLVYRKIFPARYKMAKRVPLIGVARSQWTLDEFRDRARRSIDEHGDGADPKTLAGPEPTELKVVNHHDDDEMDAYERLLGDARATPVHEYESGSWGPPDASRLTAVVGGWHCPPG